MKFAKKSKERHIATFDIRDFIEIIFGIFVGLFVFISATELWTIGAALTDTVAIILAIVNLFLIYGITKYLAGRHKKGSIFLESVKYPIQRTIVVYVIGFIVCLVSIWELDRLGLMETFILKTHPGVLPLDIRIALFANLLSTLFAATIDLSVVE